MCPFQSKTKENVFTYSKYLDVTNLLPKDVLDKNNRKVYRTNKYSFLIIKLLIIK